ncbi:Ppx/GppA phosphatase family protein [Nocardia thailandica]
MRSGILDIGSNCAQFLVVETFPGSPPLPVHRAKEAILLGESLTTTGAIEPAGVSRTVDAVRRTMAAARRFEVDDFYAFVTAAIRDAPNRDDVLDRIEDAAGFRPQYLSGVQEARLTYHAVRHWYGWRAGTLLMLDIGGGSMEIVLGRDIEPSFAASLPLGAGRLTRGFFTDDPPSRTERRDLRRHVRECLAPVRDRLQWEDVPRRVVGSSKTFKQLARLSGAAPQRRGPFVTRHLVRDDLGCRARELAALSAEERAGLRGVSAPRAGQILAGALVARTTMQELGIDRLEVSPWALREGVVLRYVCRPVDTEADTVLRPFRIPDAPRPGTLELLHGRAPVPRRV